MMAGSIRMISLALFLQIIHAVSARSPLALLGRSSPVATPNAAIGPGGSSIVDSDHFRFYDAPAEKVQEAISLVEGAFECFVGTLGWRNPNLSFNDDTDADGPYTSTNVFTVADLGGSAGVMKSDAATGMAYMEVLGEYLTRNTIVHEFGHVIHYHQKTWVDQANTGTWWEALANWVAETFMTSDLCSAARAQFNVATATTSIFDPVKVIGDSFQVIVDGTTGSGNYYQSWPFLTYITNNPDGFAGLGTDTLHQMMLQYSVNSNETPLHTLDRVATNVTAAQIVGKYWARMAYVDIGHPLAQASYLSARAAGSINFANVDNVGTDTYQVKAARQPRYMGANIIPLTASAGAQVSVQVTAIANAAFTATLAVRNTSANTVRYVDLAAGAGSVTVENDEEASLVVANTPDALIDYSGFELDGSPASTGLDYSFVLSGASA